jgi:hypothetical protein
MDRWKLAELLEAHVQSMEELYGEEYKEDVADAVSFIPQEEREEVNEPKEGQLVVYQPRQEFKEREEAKEREEGKSIADKILRQQQIEFSRYSPVVNAPVFQIPPSLQGELGEPPPYPIDVIPLRQGEITPAEYEYKGEVVEQRPTIDKWKLAELLEAHVQSMEELYGEEYKAEVADAVLFIPQEEEEEEEQPGEQPEEEIQPLPLVRRPPPLPLSRPPPLPPRRVAIPIEYLQVQNPAEQEPVAEPVAEHSFYRPFGILDLDVEANNLFAAYERAIDTANKLADDSEYGGKRKFIKKFKSEVEDHKFILEIDAAARKEFENEDTTYLKRNYPTIYEKTMTEYEQNEYLRAKDAIKGQKGVKMARFKQNIKKNYPLFYKNKFKYVETLNATKGEMDKKFKDALKKIVMKNNRIRKKDNPAYVGIKTKDVHIEYLSRLMQQ